MMTITKVSFMLVVISIMITGMISLANTFNTSTGAQPTTVQANTNTSITAYEEQLEEKISQLQPPTSSDLGPLTIVSNAWSTLSFIFTTFPSLLLDIINTTATWIGAPSILVGAITLLAGLFVSYTILRVIFKTEV